MPYSYRKPNDVTRRHYVFIDLQKYSIHSYVEKLVMHISIKFYLSRRIILLVIAIKPTDK
jgi:hypothetical protein